MLDSVHLTLHVWVKVQNTEPTYHDSIRVVNDDIEDILHKECETEKEGNDTSLAAMANLQALMVLL